MTVVILWVGALVAMIIALAFVSAPPQPEPLWTGSTLGGTGVPMLHQAAGLTTSR